MKVSITIRKTRERTSDLCLDILNLAYPDNAIKIIEASPFSLALEACLKYGIESKCDLLLCIDADVLINATNINRLIGKMISLKEDIVELQGLIHDGIFKVYRPAGHHLYRARALPLLLEILKKRESDIRPEFTMLQNGAKQGLHWMQCDLKVGLHDYAQSASDYKRKILFHSLKHKDAYQQAVNIGLLPEEDQIQKTQTNIEYFLDANQFNKLLIEENKVEKEIEQKERQKLMELINSVEDLPVNKEIQNTLFPYKNWNRLRDGSN